MIDNTKILIVDDYPINIQSLKELVSFENTDVYSATSADKALELLMEHDFAVALLDVQMPDVNGFELAKMIKGVKKLKQLPIIFVTAENQDNALIFEAYKTGAVDVLFKPLIPAVVRSKVSIFVELSHQRELLKQQVKEMESLKIKAESASVAKGRFLANMSHEIRTPLAAVLGYSELIDRNASNYEEVKEYCSIIARNGKLLRSLIDSIFDLSKIEAEKLELSSEKFDLKDVFTDLKSTLDFQANEKDISLIFNDNKLNDSIYLGDPTRLKQIFINIIGNAIKFTSEGKVEVVASLGDGPTKDFKRLKVTVSDEGIGIEEEQAEGLFEAFSQADGSNKRKFGGAGLGLAISREIARSMGGDITLLRSVEGEGTIFLIEVELNIIENKSSSPNRDERKTVKNFDFNQFKVLCVDDSKDNLRLLELILSETNIQVDLANGGVEALAASKKNEYDIILMDIQMPVMDGFETTKTLRQNGYSKPILAVTAHVMAEEHKKCLDAGCDAILSKPLVQSELLNKMHNFLHEHQ